MFASYEIGTSCTSLTAITRYDLDESADVLLMDHLCIVESTMMKGKGNISLEEDRKSSMNIWWKHSSYQENGGDLGIKISWKLNISEEVNNDEEISTVNAEEFWRQHSISALHFFNQRNTTWYQAEAVCVSNGGHLVSIASKDEFHDVKNIHKGHFWLGGSDEAVEGNWTGVTEKTGRKNTEIGMSQMACKAKTV